MSSLRDILNPQVPPLSAASSPRSDAEASSPPCPSSSSASGAEATPLPVETGEKSSGSTAKEHELHTDCPNTLDCLTNSEERPPHTLPVILRCTILGSEKKRLTIREIYAAMEKKYPYYKTAPASWKQSVRHHLSLNRLFERQAKPAAEPGFGSYWTVNLDAPPGTKRPRKRGRKPSDDDTDGQPKPRGRPRKIAPYPKALDNSGLLMPPSPKRVRRTPPVGSEHSDPTSSPYGRHSHVPELLHKFDSEGSIADEPSSMVSDNASETDDDILDFPGEWQHSDRGSIPVSASPAIKSDLIEMPYSPASVQDHTDTLLRLLQDEVQHLRGQVDVATSTSAKMSIELGKAQAEITLLRSQYRTLERVLGKESVQRSA